MRMIKNDAARALVQAANRRDRSWGWSYCQVSTTVIPAEIGGKEAYNVCIDVNGMPHALRTLEQAEGHQYSVYWRMDFTSLPMLLGHYNDPDEALDSAEHTISVVVSGLQRPEEIGK